MKKVFMNQRGAIPVLVALCMAMLGGVAFIHANDVVNDTDHLQEITTKIGNALQCDSSIPCIKCHANGSENGIKAQ